MGGSYKCGNKFSGPIKFWEFRVFVPLIVSREGLWSMELDGYLLIYFEGL